MYPTQEDSENAPPTETTQKPDRSLTLAPGGDVPKNVYFAEEHPGWHGYVEWEDYPEKRAEASEILKNYDFPPPPEFQLVPLPRTNPILEGVRWKQYHYALGPTLENIPDESWEIVLEEKSPDMIHVLQFPYNGEPPRSRLVDNPITTNEDHFVRNHGGIPTIDEDAFFLDVGGLVNTPRRITLAELKDESIFPRQSNIVTLQCSGTRRIEQIHEYPGDGDELINAPWGEGAIATARWTGVSLKKVLKYCGGLKEGTKDIEFIGADTYFKKGALYNYAVSVPYRKVKAHEVLLAWEMNGKPLPKIHGAPLRVVVFGYIGARSCKWVYKINALAKPSRGPVQMKEYLYYTPQIGKQNATYSSGFSIQDMPVSSAIMAPVDMDQIIHSGSIRLKGWAYSGGGHWPVRVEVSGDGGSVWYQVPYENMSKGWLEVCVRCWDNSMNTQPTAVRSAWNWDLHVTSSCHRIKIYSINDTKPATARKLAIFKAKGVSILPITQPAEWDLEDDDTFDTEMEKMGGRDPEE